MATQLVVEEQDSAYWDEAEHRLRESGVRLPERQRAMLEADIRASLARREQLLADRARYPVITGQRVDAPIIVIGLPRSGTTLLHGVLSQDPRARSPLWWETDELSPPPGLDPEADGRRIAQTQAKLEQIPAEMLARHRKGPLLPEECGNAFQPLAFQSMVPWATYGTEEHLDWIIARADMRVGFRMVRHGLQHLQTFSPGQWWVLKNPTDLFCLDARLAEFPDARLVFIHRDPADVIPSNASLTHFVRGLCGLEADKAAIGARIAEVWSLAVQRMLDFRHANPAAGNPIDVHHADLSRDPLGTISRIYHHFGMALSAEAETAMTSFMANNGKGKHGGHRYTAEEFGLTGATLRARFARYIETYGVEGRA